MCATRGGCLRSAPTQNLHQACRRDFSGKSSCERNVRKFYLRVHVLCRRMVYRSCTLSIYASSFICMYFPLEPYISARACLCITNSVKKLPSPSLWTVSHTRESTWAAARNSHFGRRTSRRPAQLDVSMRNRHYKKWRFVALAVFIDPRRHR